MAKPATPRPSYEEECDSQPLRQRTFITCRILESKACSTSDVRLYFLLRLAAAAAHAPAINQTSLASELTEVWRDGAETASCGPPEETVARKEVATASRWPSGKGDDKAFAVQYRRRFGKTQARHGAVTWQKRWGHADLFCCACQK
ncbi:hypothetical protein HDU90_005341 [Geranomyces variabilis]|nr:hypothetical protein HDU90_005341 [Geranomyces variabilis]